MNDNNKRVWFELLYYWCYKKNKSGLTIPFLIGSEKYLDNNHITIKELLIEFIENKNIYYTSIEYCNVINEYVVKLYLEEDLISLINYPKYGKLYIQDDIMENFIDVNDISNFFENRYSEYIQNEKYSKNNGEFVKFDTDDILMFNKIK